MSKQEIVNHIIMKCNNLGIAYETNNETDISISMNFLDAAWSTGKKKITYEAAVLVDEDSKTVYMWEMTKEEGRGLSFGSDSSSTFQSGKTLFRKVKSIQYGPDGKAFEYDLNLGDITKAVKEAANMFDWKFKTVINKNKALYSNLAKQAVPQQSVTKDIENETNGKKKEQKSEKKKGKPAFITIIIVAILTVILLLFSKASLLGWVISIAVLAGGFILQRKMGKKGCLLNILLIAAIVVILLATIGLTSNLEDDISISTATLSNPQMTTQIDDSGYPVDNVSSYNVNAPEIIAAAELHNAPPDTNVRFVWTYVTENVQITEYNMVNEDQTNVYVYSFITNDKPWPTGEYQVDIYIENRANPDATVSFTVSDSISASGASSNSSNTANIDEINMVEYFQKILDRVKSEWKEDAQIISIRLDKSYEKNFNLLSDLKVDSDWLVVFYSLSTKNEAVVDLDNSIKDSQGVPLIKYHTEMNGSLTMEEVKQTGARLYEFNRPETASINEKVPENCLTGCNMKMSEITSVLSDRFKNENPIENGYFITINGVEGPKFDVYWEKDGAKNRFNIKLDTKETYDKL